MSSTSSFAPFSLSGEDTSLTYRTAKMALKLPKNLELKGIAILAVCLVYTVILFWLAAIIHTSYIVFNWTKFTFKGSSQVTEMSVHVGSTDAARLEQHSDTYTTSTCSSAATSTTTSPCSSRAASPVSSPLLVRKTESTAVFSRSSTWVLSPVSRKKTMRKLL